ncbi:MAG: DUF370 domain-containing protein [Desulfotalea sp.]
MLLLNVGFGNMVAVDRLIAIVATGSSPARKIKENAKNIGKLLDVTEGRRTRSMLVMDSEHVVLSSVQPDTIKQRILDLNIQNNLKEQEK